VLSRRASSPKSRGGRKKKEKNQVAENVLCKPRVSGRFIFFFPAVFAPPGPNRTPSSPSDFDSRGWGRIFCIFFLLLFIPREAPASAAGWRCREFKLNLNNSLTCHWGGEGRGKKKRGKKTPKPWEEFRFLPPKGSRASGLCPNTGCKPPRAGARCCQQPLRGTPAPRTPPRQRRTGAPTTPAL